MLESNLQKQSILWLRNRSQQLESVEFQSMKPVQLVVLGKQR